MTAWDEKLLGRALSALNIRRAGPRITQLKGVELVTVVELPAPPHMVAFVVTVIVGAAADARVRTSDSVASLMIAAGVNAKALSTYMGHANIAITLDRYGHLMPGNEGEAAGLLDAYLDAAAAAK